MKIVRQLVKLIFERAIHSCLSSNLSYSGEAHFLDSEVTLQHSGIHLLVYRMCVWHLGQQLFFFAVLFFNIIFSIYISHLIKSLQFIHVFKKEQVDQTHMLKAGKEIYINIYNNLD